MLTVMRFFLKLLTAEFVDYELKLGARTHTNTQTCKHTDTQKDWAHRFPYDNRCAEGCLVGEQRVENDLLTSLGRPTSNHKMKVS